MQFIIITVIITIIITIIIIRYPIQQTKVNKGQHKLRNWKEHTDKHI